MSVVCAKVYNDKIVVAADSIVTYGWSKNTKGDFSKLTRVNDMIIGTSGSVTEGGLMWQYMRTHKPATASTSDVLDFLTEFSRWKNDLTQNAEVANEYLLAFNGKLFTAEGMFPYEVKTFASIGAGMDFGNAAMHLGHTPREAVKVACDLCCFVAEPILEEVMLF
jgi:ATP-dependent protease HslVU (ClpYQ) peptidase subunit